MSHPRQQRTGLSPERANTRDDLALALTECSRAVRAADSEEGIATAVEVLLFIADEIRKAGFLRSSSTLTVAPRSSAADIQALLRQASNRLAGIRAPSRQR